MAYAVRRPLVRFLTSVVAVVLAGGIAAADEPGFESLFDGKSLAGWKANENPGS